MKLIRKKYLLNGIPEMPATYRDLHKAIVSDVIITKQYVNLIEIEYIEEVDKALEYVDADMTFVASINAEISIFFNDVLRLKRPERLNYVSACDRYKY